MKLAPCQLYCRFKASQSWVCWAKSRSFRGGSAPLHINSSELRKTSRQLMFCWHVLPHFVSFHFSHFIILDSFQPRLHGKLQRIPPKCHNSTCQNTAALSGECEMWNSCNVDMQRMQRLMGFDAIWGADADPLKMILETSFYTQCGTWCCLIGQLRHERI